MVIVFQTTQQAEIRDEGLLLQIINWTEAQYKNLDVKNDR